MSYESKRNLCMKIAEAYKEKSFSNLNESAKMGGEVTDNMHSVLSSNGREDLPEQTKETVGLLGAFVFLGGLHNSSKYSAEAEKYEKLANSLKLYFIRQSKLEKVLQDLPVGEKPHVYAMQTPSGKVHRLAVK